MNCLLMALKPRFADEILSGLKKCEVRAFMGSVSQGDVILVYYSSPIKSVRGYFTVGDSIIVKPSELMNAIRSRCDMPKDNLDYVLTKYLRSRRRILIIDVVNPVIFPKAVSLDELRRLNVKIPRSYIKLSHETCREIMTKALKSTHSELELPGWPS